MNNNLEKIGNLLHFFKNILIENPNIILTTNIIYNNLIKSSVSKQEWNVNISNDNMFDKWKQLNLDNITCFEDTSNSLYSFFNKLEEIDKIKNPIKVYIPIDYEHIFEGVTKLLGFFSKKNMSFQMKISKNIRLDNIIIRLTTLDDLNKLLNFIKYNEYINEGLLEPNPFTYIQENVGIVIDGNLSYNWIVANFVAQYLNHKKITNKLEEIKVFDLYNYVIDEYKNNFINLSTYNTIKISETKLDQNSITYYKQITELILKISEPEFTREDFDKHFTEVNDIEQFKNEANTYNTLNTLTNYISIQSKKQSIESLYESLQMYINTGKLEYITNACSLRANMYFSNFKENIENILKDKNITLKDLFNCIQSQDIEKEISCNQLDVIEDDTKIILTQIVKDLSQIYSYKEALEIIQIYLATNDYLILTREKNIREIAVTNNIRNNVLSILFKRQISFLDYIKDLDINLDINLNIDYEKVFSDATKETYNKYQELYDAKKIDFDGFTLVNYAIHNLVLNNDCKSFTRENEARKNISKLTRDNVFEIMLKKLELPKVKLENTLDEDIDDIIRSYIDNILDTRES